ncbi:hypothetical protein N9166_01515 [bacterium]|nr:hypothetical protein [bacterium]
MNGSRLPPILAALVEAAILLDLALIAYVKIRRGFSLEISSWEFGVARIDLPIAVLLVLALAWCALNGAALRRVLRVRLAARTGLRRPSLLALVVAPVSLGLFAANAHTLVGRFERDVIRHLEEASPPFLRGMVLNVNNRHAISLARHLTTRPNPGSVVVHFATRDRRGHLPAYYLYPILLRMEPEERRWGLRERMLPTRHRDPAFRFDVRERPDIARSIEFAREARQDLLAVDGKAVTVLFDAAPVVPD